MNLEPDRNDMYINTYVTDHHLDNGHEHGYPPQSAGSSGSAKQGSSSEAAFKCDFCTKSFTRKDHLVRHKANHSQQNHYCGICRRAFKRLDLLQRHEKRQICTAADFPRPKRRRSSSASSNESDSQPPYTASTQTYMNPHPNPASMFSDMSATSFDMGGTVDPMATSSVGDQSEVMINPIPPPLGDHGTEFPADTTDFGLGFGLWPPESWEALFQNEVQPAWLDPATVTVDLPFQSLTPRMQESSERGQLSLASAPLVVKLSNEFPDIHFTLNFVTESLNHYWSNIAPTFPFIHRGTFDFDEAPNELILMMIIVGHMNTTAHRDFSQTVAGIRGRLVQNCGLDMPITTLQCFTLCHVYDTWFGTSNSQFVAQCLWPVMVAHSRKKAIGVLGRTDQDSPQEEEAWAAWAKSEETRRSVYCILLMDTQLSAFWNQHVSRQLSIFAHHVALPCARAQWEATTASDWFRVRDPVIPPAKTAHQNRQKSGQLPGLHPEFQVSHISEGYSSVVLETLAAENALVKTYRADLENCLTVEMALMGLMAIAWDCRTRGGMGIRFREGVKHWRVIVINAVIHLRATWETNVQHLPAGTELRDMRDTFAISIISVLSDIPMLQVAAGATQVCGSPIGNRQYADAKRRLRLWAKSEDAWTCIWQSMRYIRQALFADWGLYTPWAVYLTTLVAWAYTTGTSSEIHQPITSDPDRSFAYANQLVDIILGSSTRIEPKEHLGDLVAASAEMLEQDRAGRGVMHMEMSDLLWRLMRDGQPERSRASRERYPLNPQ